MSYLSFSRSTYAYAKGKSVGDPSNIKDGSGLKDKAVTVVEIPSFYEGENVVEIAQASFLGTSIEKIFIPRTIKYIGNAAFMDCEKLNEVRFESGSMLEEMSDNVFQCDDSLTKFDMPSNLKKLDYDESNYLFPTVFSLTCFSYLGSTDFSYAYVFEINNNPEVHVSDSLYPRAQFGRRDVIKDGKTCGVSNDPFSGKKKTPKNRLIGNKKNVYAIVMILFLVS